MDNTDKNILNANSALSQSIRILSLHSTSIDISKQSKKLGLIKLDEITKLSTDGILQYFLTNSMTKKAIIIENKIK